MSATHAASAREVAALISGAPEQELDLLLDRYGDDPRRQVVHAIEAAVRRRDRARAERERVLGMYRLQDELSGGGVVVGVDEVGRGALAGPLTIGAVVLPAEPIVWGINDSKQLSPKRRSELAADIVCRAEAIGIAHVAPEAIDAVGMAAALRVGMAQAIEDTGVDPDCVLIDGNPVHAHPKERTLVKGDARIASIAAASIVAKVTRDDLMVGYSGEYPEYHLDECKGYGSPSHIEAIRMHGLTPLHRVSFCGNFIEPARLF